jgi:hypothetical protein
MPGLSVPGPVFVKEENERLDTSRMISLASGPLFPTPGMLLQLPGNKSQVNSSIVYFVKIL